ncbi:hypothetical protein N7457_007839 [Penicillium paradoxum]|uniref:uncharacterized protein n=1 Tax=Penicillium paradoxum TaxID=176176 RepID=UPI002547568C|nr:uncharacterized protein N7457_007839 [Penicillium paradoxum]KAJ5772943.1 hypothetical protein N7457_007839 [Penicillium paradoxum]
MLSRISLSSRSLRVILVGVSILFGVVMLLYLPTASSSSKVDFVVPAKQIDWSRFAYTQYATERPYLCNSVMMFETLNRLGSKADRVLMYSSEWSMAEDADTYESNLLRYARDRYAVKLKPIEVQMRPGNDKTWAKSYTKLLAFNQTEYDRVLNLDSDATILRTMDELFFLPSSPVVMPLAYWVEHEKPKLTSAMILIQPSVAGFHRTMDAISRANCSMFDMEIMNLMYGDTNLTIPHRPYILLTGEFRSKDHKAYLGNAHEKWNAEKIFREAKYLHFSDWPVPKPWNTPLPDVMEDSQPPCELNPATGKEDDCHAQKIWLGIYEDFQKRREEICDTAVREGEPREEEP